MRRFRCYIWSVQKNPALGKTADQLLNQGGTIVMGETTEIIGAEHIVAQKAVSEEVANKLYAYVNKFEKEVERIGADMRGGNPSPGNIEGGLSTIEEKSLGCISKAGTAPLNDVLSFAEEIPGNGYYFMDSPGNDIECVSGMVTLVFIWSALRQEEGRRLETQLFRSSK